MDIKEQTYQLIDDLKAVCHNYGMGMTKRIQIITEVFLINF